MIERLVSSVLKIHTIVIGLVLAAVAAGVYAYSQLDIEAYPNPVPPMLEIITQPSGLSAEEVERTVTIPIETELSGMVDLDHIRSQSLFGLSDVKCYFTWRPDYVTAQQRVLNRLPFITLPNNLQPGLSPWSAIGELYRYQLISGRNKKTGEPEWSLQDLRTAQDWILEKQFRQVPGVIDVNGFGGTEKQYQVLVDPYRMIGHGVTLPQVSAALGNSNQSVGGGYLSLGEQSFDVRGTGLIQNLKDIENVSITAQHGTAVHVKDVATVATGFAPRLGIVGHDADPDVVEGIVLMRYGGESIPTLKGIHDRNRRIQDYHLLPPGMEMVPIYDRADLVEITTHTVIENLLTGMVLVSLVLWLFLGNTRAALITALNIPIALLVAFIGMVSTGTPANLISLGAVDFGIVVDSTVIVMENVFRHLSTAQGGSKVDRIAAAVHEVGPPMFFSTLIIATAFIPLFAMSGVAGVIFAPMAHTYAFAIGGAILLALTLTPVLADRLLPVVAARGLMPIGAGGEEPESTPVTRALERAYQPLFNFALRRKRVAVGLCVGLVVLALSLTRFLGGEFMPKLEEGNLWIRATLPLSVSLEQSAKYVGRMRSIILGCPGEDAADCPADKRAHPEVISVVSQLGRPDDGTDPSGFYNIEIFAPLYPRNQWRHGMTKDKLTDELSDALQKSFPGVVFNFSQMISDNVEEAMSGVKGENTVKVFGPNLKDDQTIAAAIVGEMNTVKGVEDLGLVQAMGQPNLRIVPDRALAARYGINVGDVAAVIQAAIGGQALTQVFEGERHFDLVVRWLPQYRSDLRALRNIPVAAPDGAQIPLGQLATFIPEDGASTVYREDNQRYVPVKFSVRGRDLASTIQEAKDKIDAHVKRPWEMHLEWAGEINELHEAAGRLLIIVPMTLLLIMGLVFTSVKTWTDTFIVLAGIPVACAGGVLGMLVTRTDFSISAAMGFISIFGIAIQDSLIVVSYAQHLWKLGHGIEEGARLAAERRLRPVLMTTCVAMLGLTPAALSHGIGSETQKPLAIVVIGGALVLAIVPRLLQPALLTLLHREKSGAVGKVPATP